MPPLIDLAGKQFGLLIVKKRDINRSRKHAYWICECQCENKTIVSVRGDHLQTGNTVSCGCVNAKNIHKKRRNSIDITDKRFGKLVAKYYVKSGKEGAIWHCECECGKSINTYVSYLTRGDVLSCGCAGKENRKKQNAKLQGMILENTNVSLIKKTGPNKNSTTGIRGVSWCASKQKYIATITFRKKRYYLCASTDIGVCKAARKEAENRLYGDFWEWYESNKKNCSRKD